tara:strand:- start:888 stop:2807 length:1920 start_codon:yes stop_codon:yes gene_type:complete
MAIPNMAMIPSGYKPTKLYSVLPTPSYGSEEITNGDFSTDTWWSKDLSWTIGGGSANSNGSGYIFKGGVLTIGKTYLVSFDISSYISGSLTYPIGGFTAPSSVGTYSFTYQASSQTVSFSGNSFIGSIDNISVQEVLVSDADFDVSRASSATRVNQQGLIETPEFILSDDLVTNGDFATDSDWTKGTGWSISSGNAIASNVPSGNILSQNITFTSGKTYKIVFEIKSISSGGIKVRFPSVGSSIVRTTVGIYEEYITSDGTNSLVGFQAINTTTAAIDNVSVVQVEREDIPRLDYTDGGCPVLLTEPQSTNLIADSEDFSQWNNTNITLISGFTSPSGDDSAYSLTTDANSSSKLNFSLGSLSASTEHSVSVFVKKVGSDNQATLRYYSVEANFHGVAFDFDTKVLSNQIGTTTNRQVQELSNGWFRISYTFTTSSVVTNPGVQLSRDNANKTVLYYGAQIEELSYATSYIPTYGAISTRASETINNAGDVNTFNSTEGTLFVEIAALSDDLTNRSIRLSDGSVSNYVAIRFNNGGSNRIYTRVNVGSSISYFHLDSSHNITDTNKIAIRYKDSDFATFINGVKVSSQTSGSLFPINTLNDLSFYGGNSVNEPFYGKTSQVQVYNTALSDSELQILTTI